tara:strand:+ start:585 stop:743 length:159 start_codon:yes stop_codon:yes gene_type:complete
MGKKTKNINPWDKSSSAAPTKPSLWNKMKNIKSTIKTRREEEKKRIQEMLGN